MMVSVAGTRNLRTHRIQEVSQVQHFGLARRIFQHGRATRQRGRHHQVLRAGYGYCFENQMRTRQSITASRCT